MVVLRIISLFIVLTTAAKSASVPCGYEGYRLNEGALVGRFLKYLRIRIESVTQYKNETAWEEALKFWEDEARQLSLKFSVFYPRSKPVVVLTLRGARPNLPAVMMNSHMDVVPVEDLDLWVNDPFNPVVKNGTIVGRGTQDCKSLAIAQLEVLRYYQETCTKPLRTLHMTLMPDEETGGFEGMQVFVKTEDFKKLNVGFALDEGGPSVDDHFYALYWDKRAWQMHYNIRGAAGGHGAIMHNGTAVEKLSNLLQDVFAFRREQMKIQKSVEKLDAGAYTSVNVNIVKAGVATNVVPSSVTVVVDMRLSTHANTTQIQEKVEGWLRNNSGPNSTLTYERQMFDSRATAVDGSNPFWVAMQNFAAKINKQVTPIVCPMTSDMSYVRARGIPAIGFSPIPNTTPLAHATNEYITTDALFKTCQYYLELIKIVSSVPSST